MEKNEFRVLIKHYFLRGKTAKETKEKLDKYYGSAAPSNSTVKKWMHDFKLGRINTNDAVRTGRPAEVTTPDMISKILRLVSEEKSIKIREIGKIFQISTERVGNILNEHLKLKKFYACWVPQELTAEQKCERRKISEQNLKCYSENPKMFLQQYITVGNFWIHYEEISENTTKRLKYENMTEKLLVKIAWNANGILMLDFNQKEDTSFLDHLKENLMQDNSNILQHEVLLHQDNVAVYESPKLKSKLNELNIKLLPHPSHAPDLIPFQLYLYPDLKKWLDVRKFGSIKDIKIELNGYFKTLADNYFIKSIEILIDRWSKCVEFDGNYVEE